jgi:hypothetical protein
MKKQGLKIFLMFCVLAILAVLPVRAQFSNEQTATIPFSFNVGGKTFPAGQYNVKRLNPQSDKAALAITSVDGRMSRVVLTTPILANSVQESAKLIFNRYGGQYFLAQVWTPADATGLELPKSRSEREWARNVGEHAPERVAIALNARRR